MLPNVDCALAINGISRKTGKRKRRFGFISQPPFQLKNILVDARRRRNPSLPTGDFPLHGRALLLGFTGYLDDIFVAPETSRKLPGRLWPGAKMARSTLSAPF